MSNNLLIASFLLCFLSCSSKEDKIQLKRVDFIQAVSKEYKNRIYLKSGEYLTFRFLNQYYNTDSDTSDYSRSLFITIPATDTVFTFKNDSTHLFQHLVTNCRGLCPDIEIEEIKSGKISGKLIEKDKWQINAKTKYFDFKRVIQLTFKTLEVETIRL